MKIRIALLEDDGQDRRQTLLCLQRFFAEMNIEYETVLFDDAKSFLSYGKAYSDFHLMLLDILLGGEQNGVDLARVVRKVNRDVAIMFITKTAQFAINGYEVDAIDYVLKPLVYEEFAFKLKKALRYILLHMEKFIVIDHKEGQTRISERSIYYVEVIRHYLTVHTRRGDYVVRGTMKDFVSELSECFCRCSNSYLVNLRYVESVSATEVSVSMSGGEETAKLPLTKTYKADFLRAFRAYMGVT